MKSTFQDISLWQTSKAIDVTKNDFSLFDFQIIEYKLSTVLQSTKNHFATHSSIYSVVLL